MAVTQQTHRLSFGLFEVDLQAGELWKAGYKVRLAGQPFTVLTSLLAKPGELVTREELQSQVWGANTTVDFERALAGAINKVREALGDSADNPRFIQTLPKRGYRFIAPVLSVPAPHRGADEIEPAPRPAAMPHDPPTQGASVPSALAAPLSVIDLAVGAPSASPTTLPTRLPSPRAGWFLSTPAIASIALLFVALLALILRLWTGQSESTPLRIEQLTRSGAISAGPPNLESLLTLATDGNRILTSVMKEGRPRLSAISLGTGEVEPIPLPQELISSSLADISKDSSKLLLKSQLSTASEQPLWIVPSSGGSAERVGNVLAHDASWTPDGKAILYANGNELSLFRLDNGVSTPFAHLSGRAFWMRWSPDGKLLRFTLVDPVSHGTGIWELSATGGTPRPVRAPEGESATACCGAWTADGSAYLMQVAENLWKLKGTGRSSTLTQLTNGPLRFLSPVASRSGSRIFFLGLEQPLGMQIYRPKKGFQSAPSFLANATRVDFSQDGMWVAWTDNQERLWRARAADGTDKVQLTPGYLEVFMAHWSPDGTRLALMARERGKVWRIYLVNADGGKLEPLLNEGRNEADPGWSPDGNSLVFGREPDLMGKESGPHAIHILNLQTMKREMVPGSEGLFSPRWSRDGRWIAALSLDQKSIMLFNVSQQHWSILAHTSAADPCWSADSKSLYVHAFLEERQPILRISVPNGETHVVADLGGFHDQETVNYFFGGVTPASELLVQPRIGAGNLYAMDLNIR